MGLLDKKDVIVIGGGQSGLATAYYLVKNSIDYLILDDNENAGGNWNHVWDSLNLFSPSDYSSLPGWMMPKSSNKYPTKSEVISYLSEYEKRYNIQVNRPTKVLNITKNENRFNVETNNGNYESKVIVSATGNYKNPFIPNYKGLSEFNGSQIHSANYKNEQEFIGKNVLIVGGGNSAAQILAEVSKVAHTKWITLEPPEFLPDDVDGRILFEVASERYKEIQKSSNSNNKPLLNQIVMIDSVKDARDRGVLKARSSNLKFTIDGVEWDNGDKEKIDCVIWCTGFKSNINHLRNLNIFDNEGKIPTENSKSLLVDGLWLVGYGNWTGFASATLIGVGRTAKLTSAQIIEYLLSI